MQFWKLGLKIKISFVQFSLTSHLWKKWIDTKTFLLEIYEANIKIKLSLNQSSSTIAKISRLNLFCRLNVILLD